MDGGGIAFTATKKECCGSSACSEENAPPLFDGLAAAAFSSPLPALLTGPPPSTTGCMLVEVVVVVVVAKMVTKGPFGPHNGEPYDDIGDNCAPTNVGAGTERIGEDDEEVDIVVVVALSRGRVNLRSGGLGLGSVVGSDRCCGCMGGVTGPSSPSTMMSSHASAPLLSLRKADDVVFVKHALIGRAIRSRSPFAAVSSPCGVSWCVVGVGRAESGVALGSVEAAGGGGTDELSFISVTSHNGKVTIGCNTLP